MNYRINKRRKNYSKKKKTTQEIFLPSLNNKLPINKMPNSDINISNSVRKPQNNIQKGINIKDQIIRKQEKIKKEELMFKIQKMEIIEKILFLKKR